MLRFFFARRGIALVGFLLLAGLPARAQIPPLSDQSEVSMLTILPGDQVYAEFGHSAFRVRDPDRGIDRIYNYGTFDFSDPWFIPKFTYGQLDYFLSVVPYRAAYRHYEQLRRPIIEQRLNLSPSQRNALFRFLEINARPENRTYRYDFLFDNCSTRIRDALTQALGDSVQFAPQPDPHKSFRQLLDPYVADRPALDLGFDLGLGTPADQIATPYETMFLPIYLMRAFDHASVTARGTAQPLVARTDTTLWFEGYTAIERTLDWPLWLSWMLFVLGLATTAHAYVRDTTDRVLPDALLLGTVGTVGLIIVFLWFISEHAVTNDNWNLLWAWPTHLAAAVALARRSRRAMLRYYLMATATASLGVALGWPFWPQDFHRAILPIVLLIAIRAGGQSYRLAKKSQPAPAVQASS